MEVLLYVPELPPQERLIWTDLDTLLREDDGLREDERVIRECLANRNVYTGGGGASPVFFLRRL